MKYFYVVCLIVAAGLALRAQTNLISPTTDTNAAPVVRTNTPSEIRPTEIRSKAWRGNLRSNVFFYIDDVHVDNPQMQLWSRFLTLEAPKLPSGKFNRATAETNVIIDFVNGTPPNLTTNHAVCDQAVYTSIITNLATLPAQQWQTSRVVVLSGNAVVTNNQGVFKGEPIIWDLVTDDVSTPNLKNMDINGGQTNSSSFFETPAPKPARTNVPAK
jgi:lipopolysaccharide export system protein LptA